MSEKSVDHQLARAEHQLRAFLEKTSAQLPDPKEIELMERLEHMFKELMQSKAAARQDGTSQAAHSPAQANKVIPEIICEKER